MLLRRSPRVLVLRAGAAIAALLAGASVLTTLRSVQARDARFGRARPVVVARRDLPTGTEISARDLTTRLVRAQRLEPGVLSERDDAVGATVGVPVLAGSALTRRHLDARVPAGHRAMRIVVPHGVRPRPGEAVDVFATFDPGVVGDEVEPTLVAARGAAVLHVEGGADTLAITVLVPEDDARRVAFAAAAGTLGIAVVPPEDAEPIPSRR